MWEFGAVRGTMGARVVSDLDRMPGATFFPDATLNFADNLLANRGAGVAVIFKGEDRPLRTMTLRRALSRGRGVRGRASAVRASGPAIVSPDTCRMCPRRSSPRSPRQQSVPCGPRARRTSARRAYSIDSDRSSRRSWLPLTDTPTEASATTVRARIAEVVRALPSVQRTVLVPYLGTGDTAAIRDVVAWDEFVSAGRRRRSGSSSPCRSTIRSTSSTRRAPPACRSASCMAPAARSSSTSRNISSTATSAPAIASSTSRRAAG